ncbi:MAG: hypothetical protein U0X20_09905 [Caldilineaceae bacterium]
MTNTVIWGNYAGSPPVLNQIALSDTGTVNGAYNLVQEAGLGRATATATRGLWMQRAGTCGCCRGVRPSAGTNCRRAAQRRIRGLRPVSAATDMGAYRRRGSAWRSRGATGGPTVAAAFAAPLAVQVASSRGGR